jgi:hypothetical protein
MRGENERTIRTGIRPLERTDQLFLYESFYDDGKNEVIRGVELVSANGTDCMFVDPHMQSTQGIEWTPSTVRD